MYYINADGMGWDGLLLMFDDRHEDKKVGARHMFASVQQGVGGMASFE